MVCGGARHPAWRPWRESLHAAAGPRAAPSRQQIGCPAHPAALFNMSGSQLKSPFESEQEGGSRASGELPDSKAAEIADGSKLHTDGASEEEEEDIPLLK